MSESKTILVCGSRGWRDGDLIQATLRDHIVGSPTSYTLIHGNANGADRMAGYLGAAWGMRVISFPADWDKHGRAAGPIRNQQMLDEGKPSLVLAFNLGTPGTNDMISRAKKAGIEVHEVCPLRLGAREVVR